MSTPLRDESPGYHHVVTRGNNKRRIFVDDRDRRLFSLTVERVARRYGWTVLAYCLMDNHYHLLITVGERGLSGGMCELNTGYARTFNARHGRINHLFGRRYWSRRITTQASLLTVIRYIVQNPRAAGGSKPLESYRWTSYAATIGLAVADIELAREKVLSLFSPDRERALDEFRTLCGGAAVLREPARWQPP